MYHNDNSLVVMLAMTAIPIVIVVVLRIVTIHVGIELKCCNHQTACVTECFLIKSNRT